MDCERVRLQLVRRKDGFFKGMIPDLSALDLVFFGEETGVRVWDALLEVMTVRGSTTTAAAGTGRRATAECNRVVNAAR